MSSTVHAKCKTVDKDSLMEADQELGITVSDKDGVVSCYGVKFNFNENGVANISYYDDIKKCDKQTKQLTQLSTYFTLSKRMEKAGLKCTRSLKDIVAAVSAQQKLTLEFEEIENQVGVTV